MSQNEEKKDAAADTSFIAAARKSMDDAQNEIMDLVGPVCKKHGVDLISITTLTILEDDNSVITAHVLGGQDHTTMSAPESLKEQLANNQMGLLKGAVFAAYALKEIIDDMNTSQSVKIVPVKSTTPKQSH